MADLSTLNTYSVHQLGVVEKESMEEQRSFTETISITFGDQAENHHGMQIIGSLADEGFDSDDLAASKQKFEELGCSCELVQLQNFLPRPHSNDPCLRASVLIVRGGVSCILDARDGLSKLLEEQMGLECDKKAKMRGRVVNKRARHNLCFGETSQVADIPNGKGTVVAFRDVPYLNEIRNKLSAFVGGKAKNLCAELNRYYDLKNCGIGFHGDAESKKVICLRLGGSMPLDYQWFHQTSALGKRFSTVLHHGDIYIMSEKATGWDWKSVVCSHYGTQQAAKSFVQLKKGVNNPIQRERNHVTVLEYIITISGMTTSLFYLYFFMFILAEPSYTKHATFENI